MRPNLFDNSMECKKKLQYPPFHKITFKDFFVISYILLNGMCESLSEAPREFGDELIANVQAILGRCAGVASIESVSRRRIGSIPCVGSNAPFAPFFYECFFWCKKNIPPHGGGEEYLI